MKYMRASKIIIQLLREALEQAQAAGSLPPYGEADISVEKPKRPEHGDIATNLSISLARPMQIAPYKIAQEIVSFMPASPVVSEVVPHKTGFINFRLSREWLLSLIEEIEKRGERYGWGDEGQGQRVQVEFVSVNPTGPLHVGHARGAILGSCLSNLLIAHGCEVQREYYVNDAGQQMRNFFDTLYARFMQKLGHSVPLPEPYYSGEYVAELAAKLTLELGETLNGKSEEQVKSAVSEEGLKHILKEIREVLERLGVDYDRWFSEKELIASGRQKEVIDLLEQRGHIASRDDAVWFLSSRLGADDDVVVYRSGDRHPTYFGTDIAYHYDKLFVRKFDRAIDVWGADHHGHEKRLRIAIAALGGNPDKLEIIFNQMVHLKESGVAKKLSKRKGVMLTVEELIDEVGRDACRYIFLSRSHSSHIVFDLDLAKETSSENPVYYVQYAHARLYSILEQAKMRGLSVQDGDIRLLEHERELSLLRSISTLPDVIFRAATRLEPHHLPHFAYEMSRTFQKFYEECRVISDKPEDKPLTLARLRLVSSARVALSNVLAIMGMSAPKRM